MEFIDNEEAKASDGVEPFLRTRTAGQRERYRRGVGAAAGTFHSLVRGHECLGSDSWH